MIKWPNVKMAKWPNVTIEGVNVPQSYSKAYGTSAAHDGTLSYSAFNLLECPNGFEMFHPSGDGFCHDSSNIDECQYDGGDCCLVNVRLEHCLTCICHETGIQATLAPGGKYSQVIQVRLWEVGCVQ
jgi:hypothetical protein